ncbi:MAG: hypothetical protein SWO11_09640 [Thermodesulfobacteriota bacterium]|nr:hypothetical protein [Thermodesulfobacteriota bacterium]
MDDILFVCTANICRSPFAERALKDLFFKKNKEGIHVHSAGVNIFPGLSVPPEAIRIAFELGIDVSEHTPRQVYIKIIQEADIILVMNVFHKKIILEIDPESEEKLRLLGNFGTFRGDMTEEVEVPDPYGLSSFHYRSSFNIIRDCINNLYEQMICP